MEKITVHAPKVGDKIRVNHLNYGSVEMEVISVNGNILECDFEGIEICVRLGKIYNGIEFVPRWESMLN
jgi:hypothetical protein